MGSLTELWEQYRLKPDRDEEYLSTGCSDMDKFLGGGIPLHAPSMFYGIYDIGKSVLCMQLASMATRPKKQLPNTKPPTWEGLGKKVIYIDTEVFWTPTMVAKFTGFYRNRWADIDPSKVEVFSVPSLFDLARLFGMDYTLSQSEKKTDVVVQYPKMMTETKTGKIQVRPPKEGEVQKTSSIQHDWIKGTPIYEMLQTGDYGLVIIDSQTRLIKSAIGSSMQNFSARAGAQRPLLAMYQELSQHFHVGFISTHHGVSNPMEGSVNPWGGGDIGLYIKIILGITHPDKINRDKYGPSCRRLLRHRRAGEVSYVPPVPVTLKLNWGYTNPEPMVLTGGPGRV